MTSCSTAALRVLLFQKALHVQPFAEAFNPLIAGQVLFAHTEAVPALCVKVHLDGLFRREPFAVKRNAVGRVHRERRVDYVRDDLGLPDLRAEFFFLLLPVFRTSRRIGIKADDFLCVRGEGQSEK